MRRYPMILPAVGLVVLASVISPRQVEAQDSGAVDLQAEFTNTVRPIIERYCEPCHSGDDAPAGFGIDGITHLTQVVGDPDRWNQVRNFVATSHMPPPEADQPSQKERDLIVDWIDRAMSSPLGGANRVTIRRLNRSEYNNTVRDLLYVDLTPADDFPSDDVGYGFDNIGDVLTISPLLMEKYFAAAGLLARTAISLPAFREIVLDASELTTSGNSNMTPDGDIGFYSVGRATTRQRIETPGEYAIKVTAWAQQAGPEIAKLEVRVNGRVVATFDVEGTRAKPLQYEVPTNLPVGVAEISVGFINDYYRPDAADPRQRDRNLYVRSLVITGPHGVQSNPKSHDAIVFVTPALLEHRSAARRVLSSFGERAFRRPVTREEVENLLKVYDLVRKSGDSYEKGIQVAVQAVLVSPSFLFRAELDSTPIGDGQEWLGHYEIASRLSYFLWSSMPDEELFDLARQGRLRDPETLRAQVDRMLADKKADALGEDFAAQWLNLRLLETLSPDEEVFAGFTDELKASMIGETTMYFQDLVRNNGSVLRLLDSDYTFLNAALAEHYGIAGVTGDHLRRFELRDRRRGGVLTHGSVLTVTSNPNRTSPPKRGKWILDNILGTPQPPPPPNVGVLEDSREAIAASSLRERLEQHRTAPMCASCHARIDPLGFSLENFDGVGRWRDVDEANRPIDNLGELPDGTKVDGVEGIRSYLLANSDQFVRALASKMMTYGVGRGMKPTDDEIIDRIQTVVAERGYKIRELIKQIVVSDTFLKRTTEKVTRQ
ncbi:MAG: DUF1592 domain-containing protein [Armatimonadetes bacterium]|nr:DUF1592 domain-containing protein [Armatimonadota bacterium]